MERTTGFARIVSLRFTIRGGFVRFALSPEFAAKHMVSLFREFPSRVRFPGSDSTTKNLPDWEVDFWMVGREGIEPATLGLKVPCSTN